MDLFKVVYYPNSSCTPLALAKSILMFDEILFLDHPSLTLQTYGTVGHPSEMRFPAELLKGEGYSIHIAEPSGGAIEGELQKIIDTDLGNKQFIETFLQLVKNDPSFLINTITGSADDDFGRYGSADNYAKALTSVNPDDIPLTVDALGNFRPTEMPFPPEMTIALRIASDSYLLNYASYTASQRNSQLFGDSKGMSLLLDAKFQAASDKTSSNHGVAPEAAFTLLERVIPNKAFQGKKLIDIVHFRNEMHKERERFKEHILELTVEMQDASEQERRKRLDEVIYAHFLPEVRSYQEKFAKNWDTFFKESTAGIVKNGHHTAELVARMLPISIPGALLAGAADIGSTVLPPLINYLKDKEALNRRNPYSYLLRFR